MTTAIPLMKVPPILVVIASAGATWFSVKHLPPAMLFVYLTAAIVFDLITGLIKSWKKGIATSSIGFRATVTKLGMYSAVIVGGIIIVNVLGINGNDSNVVPMFMKWLMSFLIFIECYSIFENVSETYPDSMLTKFLIDPILKLLKGKLSQTIQYESSTSKRESSRTL